MNRIIRIALCVMLVFGLSQAYASAPTIRNQSGSPSAANATLPQPVIGNCIVIVNFNISTKTSGVTDSAGNTWTHQLSNDDANTNWLNVFTAPVTSTGSGTDTISGLTDGGTWAGELQGTSSGCSVDGTPTTGTFSGSSGGTLNAASITASVANDLILSFAIDQNSATLTVNTGILVFGGVVLDYNIIQQHTTSATGGYIEKFNVPTSSGETAVIIAIALAGTGGGGVAVAPFISHGHPVMSNGKVLL